MSVYTGEYLEHTTADASTGIYYSFTPKPLMDGGFYEADEELFSLLIETHRALGVLEGMIVNMPDSDTILESTMLKESYFSLQIDYPGANMYEMLESRGAGNDNVKIENIKRAYTKAFDENMDIENLCVVHNIAKDGYVPDKPTGLRTNQIFLTNTIINYWQYSPTAPAHLSLALEDMFLYIRQSVSDTLIKAALVHYQFEMIHPFESYNGIVGRILASKVMIAGDLRATPYLSLSELLYEAQNEYFDLLSSTQKGGGYGRWIKFFAGAVHDAARRRIKQLERYRQIVKRDEEKILNYHPSRVQNVLKVFAYWKRHLISNIKQPADVLHFSYNTVERAVTVMKELGILQQTAKTQRYRKYVYSELTDLYVGTPESLEQTITKKSAAEMGNA